MTILLRGMRRVAQARFETGPMLACVAVEKYVHAMRLTKRVPRMKNTDEYIPADYWESLVGRHFDLREVGYPNLSLAFNRCMYRGMAASVTGSLERLGMSPESLRSASILDVGSGTGFWIDFWLLQGARQIEGIDLTRTSVDHLTREYPQLSFRQVDVSSELEAEYEQSYDIVSAMSVLHRIPTQIGWLRAVKNLCRVLRPGGHLLLMDPVIVHAWWGPPFDSSHHGRPRTLGEHSRALASEGVTILDVVPSISLLANPVDTRTRMEFRLLNLYWSHFGRVARREGVMDALSAPLYALDRLLVRMRYAPTSKLLLCHKTGVTGPGGTDTH